MHQVHKEKGFSLIELIIVLGLASLLISIGTGVYSHLLVEAEAKQFKKRLEQDLLYLQQYTQFDRSAKLFLEDDKYQISSSRLKKVLLVQEIPEGYTIKIYPNAMSFGFNQTGTALSPGNFTIHTPVGTDKLVFPLGKGRGRYEDSR
ncbi:type II secretion system protein [Terribacillus saccharophilus]|uniref:type II secretion system protein n=1 Tax=Terribacillus saccharophilus TaxID=361277 RepID=UPI002DCC3BAD|nr:type II secretion system protein [Terribacillus saccharophilus]MEC0290559.1 type II secretion system protein [Terribacillus saccharophilus]